MNIRVLEEQIIVSELITSETVENMVYYLQCSVFDKNSRIFKIKYIYFKILGLENTISRVFFKNTK